jgi:hypothetical protein
MSAFLFNPNDIVLLPNLSFLFFQVQIILFSGQNNDLTVVD